MYQVDNVAGMRHDAVTLTSYGHAMTQARDTDDSRGRRFATLIREGRLRRGWTQEQLEEASGVGRQTIIRWESGRAVNPDPEQVRTVCLALGIDPREAPIALGYFTREEMGLPPRQDPTIEEVVEILRDPTLSSARKEEWVNYLRYLRTHQTHPRASGE